MNQIQTFHARPLSDKGLNLQAVFEISQLPSEMAAALVEGTENAGDYRQLILLAHGGRALWQALKASGLQSDNPIDDFSMQTVRRWFAELYPGQKYTILYPGTRQINLQRLGDLAGWHHASPFMVGINARWGTWFAYRVVVLADTAFATTVAAPAASPCDSCVDKVCISRCPAAAVSDTRFDLGKCVAYRKAPASACRASCLSRVSCPVAADQRYSEEQIHYHYSCSMKVIEQNY